MKIVPHLFIMLLIFLLTGQITLGYSQHIMHGTLSDKNINTLIPGARVWIPGGPSFESTSTDGEFKLNLDVGNHYQLGGELELYISHKDYGFQRKKVLISQSLKVFVALEESNIYGVFGLVRDKGTGKPISRIEIAASSEDNTRPDKGKLPVVITDDRGYFQIILRRNQIGKLKYIRLSFRDPEGQCYKYKTELFNIMSFLDIPLEKERCNDTQLKVNTYKPKAIEITMGDQILIEPSGTMKVGLWVGVSTPKGKDGLAGFPLDGYSYLPNIPHAALLCRFSWETDRDWRYCGEKMEITAQQDGYLEFDINDNQQNDNSGAYDVKVTLIK